tara:strand:+ start:1099 stop:2205 length:1107 start_codon:yes stop_codon:yes gene_type:complete
MFWFRVALLYSLTYFIPVSTAVSDWTNNLTHLFALPAILFRFPRFLSLITLLTAAVSVAFHVADTFDYTGDWLRRLDHGFSMLLMFVAIAAVWYQDGFSIHSSVYVMCLLAGILPAALLTKPRVYPPMVVFALILATIIAFKRRNVWRGYILMVLSVTIRLLPTNADNRGHVHGIWHVLAFTAVYYAIRYHYERFDRQTPFPFKWLFVLFGIYMTLFLTYLSYDSPYTLDIHVNGTCGNLHCGECGACSNPHDYEVYVNTSETLTGDARACAFGGIFGHDEHTCLEKTGLSSNCTTCWVENMHCTKRHCMFPCLWELIHPTNNKKRLGRCLACDEYHCIDDFLACAGMSRRRAGVVTDIQRDDREICI